MIQREKNLAIGIGGLVAVFVLWLVYSSISSAFTFRQTQLTALQKQLGDKEAKKKLAIEQAKRLKILEQQSLPSDSKVALSSYQHWLETIAEQTKLSNWGVKPQPVISTRDGFDKLAFTMTADGNLDTITKFLYEFYRGDHLHKIHRLSIKVPENTKTTLMQLQLSVEALALTTASRADALNPATSTRLAESDFAKYKESIVGRNLFAPYKAPPPIEKKIVVIVDPPTPPPLPPVFDPARFAKITSILTSETEAEVWLLVQTTGKTLKLHEGDTFEVGTVKGEVTRIEFDRIEISLNGVKKTISLGNSLIDAVAVAPTLTVEPTVAVPPPEESE